jgi:steroid 5-alpha reductase family enzyme
MPFEKTNFLRVTGAAAGVAGAAQLGAFVAGRALGRRDTVDVVWAPGLAAIAGVGAALGTGDRTRRIMLATGLSIWGARLGTHIVQRIRHTGQEDPRYTELLEGDGPAKQFVKLHLTQAAAQWFISLPVQVAAASGRSSGARNMLVPAGGALLALGLLVEAVADRQKQQWHALDESERGPVLDQGLWAWSRHPNHFGDACVWTGVYLVAAAASPGELTVLSPAAMIWFLVVATGARRMEKRMQTRPAYRDYQRRVSFFIPWPPRESRGAEDAP